MLCIVFLLYLAALVMLVTLGALVNRVTRIYNMAGQDLGDEELLSPIMIGDGVQPHEHNWHNHIRHFPPGSRQRGVWL